MLPYTSVHNAMEASNVKHGALYQQTQVNPILKKTNKHWVSYAGEVLKIVTVRNVMFLRLVRNKRDSKRR